MVVTVNITMGLLLYILQYHLLFKAFVLQNRNDVIIDRIKTRVIFNTTKDLLRFTQFKMFEVPRMLFDLGQIHSLIRVFVYYSV